jgi:hypothetical protein
MASNFSIRKRRCRNELQLELCGDFDGSSAFELHEYLRTALAREQKITVDTDGLSRLPAFGCEMFRKQCGTYYGSAKGLVFKGAYALRIAPDGCLVEE